MSILGWWIAACSGAALVSTTTLGLLTFLNPSLDVQQWHEYCVYLATLIITGMSQLTIFELCILAASLLY